MKILITGNIFHNYEYSFKRAFEGLGHDVALSFFNFEGPFYFGFQTIKWLKFGLLPHKLGIKYFLNKAIDKHNKEIKNLIQNNDYDLLLVIKGLSIDPEIVSNFKGKKALWIFDSITRFPELHDQIDNYTRVFSFEPSDVPYCKNELGKSITFLPLAVDPEYYHPVKSPKKYELSFVGGRKPNREPFIKEICGDYNFALIGDFYKSKDKRIKSRVIAKNADHKFINELYNSTNVNLNIHKPQSKEAVNIRFFEILASGGGVQFVEPQKAFLDEFKDGEDLIYYHSKEELEKKLALYLNDEEKCREIAHNGYLKTINGHTWKHRAEKLLKAIK
jgi:spore maturation protein CgeB